MFPYLLMLGLPVLLVLTGVRRSGPAFAAVALLYWLMVSFRFKVGMDWDNYYYKYLFFKTRGVGELIWELEPGYHLVEWFAGNVWGGYPLVNAVAGTMFCFGFFYLARQLREPLLAVIAATPLLVVAFAMSGTRQAMAMGIVFYLFATWDRRSFVMRIAIVVLASLFHFSAIFVLIFVGLSARVSGFARAAATLSAAGLLIAILIAAPQVMQDYNDLYVSGARRVTAPGAIAQVGVLAFIGSIYLFAVRAGRQEKGRHPLQENLAIAALLAIPATAISSVGAYRFALYLWPMAMYVVSGLTASMERPQTRMAYKIVVCALSFILMVGWLSLSNNGSAWLPYQSWLLQGEGVRFRR